MFEKLYRDRSSPLNKLDLWTKCLCLLIVIPIAVFTASPFILLIIWVFLVCLIIYNRVNLRALWNQAGLYYLLLPLSTITLYVIFSTGNLYTRIFVGLELSVRFIAVITTTVLFSVVTDPIEFPLGFLRIGIPQKYGVALMVAVRMIPLIEDKVTNVLETQRARGAGISLSMAGLPKLGTQILSLAVPVVYSTLETSVALSDTLLARGYDSDRPITIFPSHYGKEDLYLTIISGFLLALAILPH